MSETAVSLCARLVCGDRRALAQAITLVESAHVSDQHDAAALSQLVLAHSGGAMRVGISGTPGAGKSTLIEVLGLQLCEAGHRVCVLAVDPSSPTSHGSILGDRTRMQQLANHPRAFIRPSPSRGTLGGTAPRTREALLLCEAAGYDVVLVETVGVGQNETAVRDVVDTFVLVLSPAGGDELQGVKRGVLELVDIVAVNKHDGIFAHDAQRTRQAYEQGCALFSPTAFADGSTWSTPALCVSALTHSGIDALWATVQQHRERLVSTQSLHARRAEQAARALWRRVEQDLIDDVRQRYRPHLTTLEDQVRDGRMSAAAAAVEVMRRVRNGA